MNNIIQQAFAGLKLQDPSNADAVATLLDKYGLRWEVEKQPLLLPCGTETPFFGIVRADNSHTFSTCKGSYVPYQNSELGELLIRISEKGGYNIHSGGAFNGGAKVFLQLDTGNTLKGIGSNNDLVKGFVTGINSHDGTNSLRWGSSNITISCQNTFAAAARDLSNRVRHTASMHDRVDDYLRQVEGIVEAEKTLFERFRRLATIPVSREDIMKVTKSITGVDVSINERQAMEKYSTISLRKTKDLLESIDSEMTQKGDTLWGLFSGVTHYTSHKMDVPRRDNARLESKYTGSGLEIDNMVLEMLN